MTPVYGRERELSRIEAAVRRGLGGDGALLLLAGEPGIGKTRLADAAERFAADSGGRTAWGRCWEAGGAPAYWPFIEVFRALGEPSPFDHVEPGEAPADARFRATDTAARRIAEAARAKPLLLVLDDLHAADAPSLKVLSLVVRSLRGLPLVVVGTYRDAEARQRRDVGTALSRIAREGELLTLAPLPEAAIAAWLAEAGGAADRADEVLRVTEGNPLFVQEILRTGGVSQRGGRLPDGLSAVLDDHLGRVAEATRAVLECAAVLGREFSPGEVARVAGLDAASVGRALAEAESAGLVAHGAQGRRLFAHMLVRDRLIESLAPARRAALEWSAGEAVVDSRADLVTAAHHFIEGHGAGDVQRVLEITRDAAERSLLHLGFEVAAELGERALALVEGRPASRAVGALLAVVAEAHLRAGSLDVGRARCLDAARVAKGLGAEDLLARAALAYGTHFATAVVDPVMVELLSDALAALAPHDHPLRARVMARLAAALVPPRPEDVDKVHAFSRESIAMARRLGDPETLLVTLNYAGSALGYQVPSEERTALIEEVVSLARSLGRRAELVNVLGFLAVLRMEAGRRAEAMAIYAEFDELLARMPQPQYQWRRAGARAALALLDGDFEEAKRIATRMMTDGDTVPAARLSGMLAHIAAAHASGDPGAIAPVAAELIERLGRIPTLAPYFSWVLAAVGRRDEATQILERIAVDTAGFPWLVAAADAAVLIGDPGLARKYYSPLRAHQFQNRMFWGPAGAFSFGPTPRLLGELALLLGEPGEAVEHFRLAVKVCEQIGSKPLLALSQTGLERAQSALAGAEAPPGRVPAADGTGLGAAPVAVGDPASRPGAPSPAAPQTPSSAPAASGPPAPGLPTLRREGEVWALERPPGAPLRLRDGKGVRYLERLLQAPGQEIHVFDLAGVEELPGDGGAVLDARAKAQYRERLEDLRDQLEEATRNADAHRARRAQAEIDALADQLAGAVGLGGRDRKAASNVERARINVQRRLRDVLDRVKELDPALGRYLEAAIRTGTYCSFQPP